MAQMKENSRKIFDYVKSMHGENITAADIADAVDLTTKQVNGSVTAFGKKGWMVRQPAEIELEDGSHKPVKFISMTEEGMNYDPDAVEETPQTEE